MQIKIFETVLEGKTLSYKQRNMVMQIKIFEIVLKGKTLSYN